MTPPFKVSCCPCCAVPLERLSASTVWSHPENGCPIQFTNVMLSDLPAWNIRLGSSYWSGWQDGLDAAQAAFVETCPTHSNEVEAFSDSLFELQRTVKSAGGDILDRGNPINYDYVRGIDTKTGRILGEHELEFSDFGRGGRSKRQRDMIRLAWLLAAGCFTIGLVVKFVVI